MNQEFINKVIALRGNSGRIWLESIPQIIKTYKQKWKLEVFPPFPLSYNYVAPAKTIEGQYVVLKISFPKNTEFNAEIEALRFFNEKAAIKILEEDLKNGVVLLERAIPGDRLRNITSDK